MSGASGSSYGDVENTITGAILYHEYNISISMGDTESCGLGGGIHVLVDPTRQWK